MFLVETQEAGIILALVFAVGLALLAGLLLRPKGTGLGPEAAPNTATERGAFVPVVIGIRRVGPVVLWVGDRRTAEEDVPNGGKGGLFGGDTPTQRIYYEKGVHALAIGPASRLLGIYVDGVLIPNSTGIDNIDSPSGTSFTFPTYGTMRIYWGTLTHPAGPALLPQILGIASNGPYIMRVEWDEYRLGTSARWPTIEYVVEVQCIQGTLVVNNPIVPINNTNPASAFLQLFTAKYPHGGGMFDDWLDFQSVEDFGDLAFTEGVGVNMVLKDGKTVEAAIGDIISDMSCVLPECKGVISIYPIREITTAVEVLDNDLIQPPIEEIQKQHLSILGDALVYEYTDREHGYRTGTIDVDDDSIGALRNQRKTKKISMKTITSRDVASIVAARRQIEDLDTATGIKLKGLRGLRAALPGQPFDLPGIGRVRMLSYKLRWSDPTVELELLKDPFDQAPIPFDDPSIPGGTVTDVLAPDLRFDVFELPFLTSPGINALAIFRHRANKSIFFSLIHVSADGINYEPSGSQSTSCAGGLLKADFAPITRMPIIEDGPIILIDDNGDEDLPVNLSAVPSDWIRGAQYMVIGRDQSAEVFYVREWVEVVADTEWQAKGLVRARFNKGLASPRFYDESMYRRFLEGEPCYIIKFSDISLNTGGLIVTGGANFVKSQPGNLEGAVPLGVVVADDLDQQSLSLITPPLAWYVCGGSHAAPPGRGRKDGVYSAALLILTVPPGGVSEDIVFEFIPTAKGNGAGMQGAGQAVEIAPVEGDFIIEMYSGPTNGTPFDELELSGTRTATMTSLLQTDGTYVYVYSRADLEADYFLSFLDDGFPSDRLEDSGHWKFLLYHFDGTLSPPVELRPHEWENNDSEWFPLVDIF